MPGGHRRAVRADEAEADRGGAELQRQAVLDLRADRDMGARG